MKLIRNEKGKKICKRGRRTFAAEDRERKWEKCADQMEIGVKNDEMGNGKMGK